jgi:peptide/nickel transport system substrate-binding protein
MTIKHGLGRAALLLLGVSALAQAAHASEPTVVPEQPAFPAQGKITYVPRDSILEFKALPEYKEPAWVTENSSRPASCRR